MKFDPSNIPPGLSWGTRGFRVGKGVSGRWWMSLSFIGFRYFWYLNNGQNRSAYDKNLIQQSPQEFLHNHNAPLTDSERNFEATTLSKIKPTSKIKRD
jgi:hypothetical protein